MRILILLSIALFGMNCRAQVVYKTFSRADFKSIIDDGVIYIKTGDKEKDSVYIAAIEKYWKVSSYEVVEIRTKQDLKELKNDRVAFFDMPFGGHEILGLSKVEHLKRDYLSTYSTIGLLPFGGFNEKTDKTTKLQFAEFMFKAWNDAIQTIADNRISKVGVGGYKAIKVKTLPKVSVLKDKTLLILDDVKNYVDLDNLTLVYGINYKLMSTSDFFDLTEEEKSKYCLLYYSVLGPKPGNAYGTTLYGTDVMIFDLENLSQVYTFHIASNVAIWQEKDLEEITEQLK